MMMQRSRIATPIALSLALSTLGLCQTLRHSIEETITIPSQLAAGMPSFKMRGARYLLRPGDILDISFTLTPEMNEEVSVQPDGFISLHAVGDIKAGGMTLPQLRTALKQQYRGVLADPEIDISLRDFEQPYFIAGGEVAKPGKYQMRGDTTVNEGVQTAGGFLSSAKHSQILLLRRNPDNTVEVKKINAKYMLASGDFREDVQLQPGDVIYVPKNRISKLKDWIPKSNLAFGHTW
jgi:polysaccharide biosynthesis/export protein